MNPGNLRASDADRDSVTEVLHTAYAEGRITLEEHAERTAAALQARTFDDLSALTTDLVPAAPRPATALSVVPDRDDPTRVTAMAAETKRGGRWTVGRSVQVNVFMGSAVLDLTEATFTTREVEVNCTQFLGSITIRVRPGTTVHVEATNVLADSSVKRIGEPDDREPRIVVRGSNILGDIQVRGPKKSGMWRRHVA
jgi:hypothetical protein